MALVRVNESEIAVNGGIESWTKGFHVVRVTLPGHAHARTFPVIGLKGIKDGQRIVIVDINIGDANVTRSDRIQGFLRSGGRDAQASIRNGRFCNVEAAFKVLSFFLIVVVVVVTARYSGFHLDGL
jgi:hypothetical protein